MLNPACPGRAGAEQSRGAVASLGAPGSFSACRPRWDLSGLIEHQATQRACAVRFPRPRRAQAVCHGWVAPLPMGAAMLALGTQRVPQGAVGVMGCGMGLPQQLLSREN